MIDEETGRETRAPRSSVTVLAAVLRRWRLVAVITVAFLVVGYAASLAVPAKYSASARVFLDQGWLQSAAGSMDPARVVRTQAELALSTGTVAAIARQAHLDPDTVTQRVTTQPSADGNYFTLTAVGATAQDAARLVQAAEDGYTSEIAAQQKAGNTAAITQLTQARAQLMQQIDQVNAELARNPGDAVLTARRDDLMAGVAGLDRKASDAVVAGSTLSSPVQLAETPRVPSAPAYPTPKRNGLIAAILGLVCGSALAWWRESRRVGEGAHSMAQERPPAAAPPGFVPLASGPGGRR